MWRQWHGDASAVTSLKAGKMCKRLVRLESDAKGFLVVWLLLYSVPTQHRRTSSAERKTDVQLGVVPASYGTVAAGCRS